jgi:hypothetical protein
MARDILTEVRKQPEWMWNLSDGQRVKATFDPSTGIETVWVGNRIVSRSTANGKPDGHVVPLGSSTNTGAYRGAAEARVVFDVFMAGFRPPSNSASPQQ